MQQTQKTKKTATYPVQYQFAPLPKGDTMLKLWELSRQCFYHTLFYHICHERNGYSEAGISYPIWDKNNNGKDLATIYGVSQKTITRARETLVEAGLIRVIRLNKDKYRYQVQVKDQAEVEAPKNEVKPVEVKDQPEVEAPIQHSGRKKWDSARAKAKANRLKAEQTGQACPDNGKNGTTLSKNDQAEKPTKPDSQRAEPKSADAPLEYPETKENKHNPKTIVLRDTKQKSGQGEKFNITKQALRAKWNSTIPDDHVIDKILQDWCERAEEPENALKYALEQCSIAEPIHHLSGFIRTNTGFQGLISAYCNEEPQILARRKKRKLDRQEQLEAREEKATQTGAKPSQTKPKSAPTGTANMNAVGKVIHLGLIKGDPNAQG